MRRGAAVGLVVLVGIAFGASCKEPAPAPAPPRIESPPPAPTKRVEPARGAVFRKDGGSLHVYVPPEVRLVDGKWDLVIHFHGGPQNQESGQTKSNLRAVIASVNLGVGSDPYGGAFRAKGSWEKLLADVEQAVAESGRASGAKLGRIGLSAWSAGFASVKAVIDDEERRDHIDAIVIADGLFTSWANKDKKIPNLRSLDALIAFAKRALAGERLLGLTNSRVPTFTYPTTEETTLSLLGTLSVPTAAPASSVGPRKGMFPTYEVHQAGFHVWGYDGDKAGDHIAQIRVMGDLLFPLIEKRWAE